MWQKTKFGKAISTRHRNYVIFGIILFIVPLSLWILNYRYIYNCIFGPFALNPETIINCSDASKLFQYYVTLPSTKAIDTGFYQTKTKSGDTEIDKAKRASAYYLVMPVGNKAILVSRSASLQFTKPTVAGELRNEETSSKGPTPEQNIRQKIVEAVPELEDRLLPIVLEVGTFQTGYYALILFTAIFWLFAALRLFQGLKGTGNMENTPLAKHFTQFADLNSIAQDLENQVNSHDIVRIGQAAVTKDWLYAPSTHRGCMHFAQMLWIKNTFTQKYIRILFIPIPVAKIYTLYFYDTYLEPLALQVQPKDIETFYYLAKERNPDIFVGYDQDLERLWSQDLANFMAAAKRKAAVQNSEGLT